MMTAFHEVLAGETNGKIDLMRYATFGSAAFDDKKARMRPKLSVAVMVKSLEV